MRQITRRTFLKGASAVGGLGSMVFGGPSLGQEAGRKLRHACIGTGGMGFSDLRSLTSHSGVEFVAFCDVDAQRLAKAAELHPHARTYSDWRVLLDKEKDRIDSVNVSTPDHTHASVTMTA